MAVASPVQRTDLLFRRLYLPTYRLKDAARYANVHVQTLAYWHYRSSRFGPVLRDRVPRRPLSYLELVEAAFVATMRGLGVRLKALRAARHYVAQTYNSEYPFAEFRFKTEGMHLLMELTESDPGFNPLGKTLADKAGQLAWEPLLSDRFAQFEYEPVGHDSTEDLLAMRWHVGGADSRVVIDPRVSFGAPVASGLPTWVIKGRFQAQESIAEIVEEFGIEEGAVKDALRFEGIAA